jgi:sensitive to high expression protein 9
MHPATRYGALLARDVQKIIPTTVSQVARASTAARVAERWRCQDSQVDSSKRRTDVWSYSRWSSRHGLGAIERAFSTSSRRLETEKKDEKDQTTPSATIHLQPPPPTETQAGEPIESPAPQPQPVHNAEPTSTETQEDATPSPPRSTPKDEPLSTPASRSSTLPSAFAKRRTEISRRMSHLMDNFLTKATLASQQINTYTGTDFSGIEALRNEIVAQEKQVKARHAAVTAQKDRHMEAHVKQASSQKEIVSLLERKSSWLPSDLERYMTLVRSEHLDEQAVQKAKEDLAEAERDLEDTRAMLEKLERKQYHEEQIWSDTIRRNSTWVTIGLMGVNIFLLLAQIIFFEPYRRRKIVREMKEALDERGMAGPGVLQAATASEVMKQVAEAESPKEVPVEVVETEVEAKVEPMPVAAQPVDTVAPVESAPVSAMEPVSNVEEPAIATDPSPIEQVPVVSIWKQLELATSWEQRLEISKTAFLDLFSERVVHLKQVDVTTIALQGAATGIAAMGVLFLLLRPHQM